MQISRDKYLNKLIGKKHNGLIKVITGIRRCGKSYLLFTMFRQHLVNSGVNEDHIVSIALDDFKNRFLTDPEHLYDYVVSSVKDSEQYYLFLDEIQLVSHFESVLNGLMRMQNIDIYVTGSNSRFLSSDIITEFRGRGDEIRVYPLSFAEFNSVRSDNFDRSWEDYIMYGGMPLVSLQSSDEDKSGYLKGLVEQVYITDIINRYNLRGLDEMGDLFNVLASNIGSLTNPKRLSDTFRSVKGIRLSQSTIASYIGYFEDAFLINRAYRFDIKGNRYINTPLKYYFVDTGIRNARLNFRQQEETHLMENVIFNELLIRGYCVDVGMVEYSSKGDDGKIVRNQLEIDFVANKGGKRLYIQSAYSLSDPAKMHQEQQSVLHVHDSFPKILIQRPYCKSWYSDEGLRVICLEDFLMGAEL
jgi:uncharacterized protein